MVATESFSGLIRASISKSVRSVADSSTALIDCLVAERLLALIGVTP